MAQKGIEDKRISLLINSPYCLRLHPWIFDEILHCKGIAASNYCKIITEITYLQIPSTDSYCRMADMLASEGLINEAKSVYENASSMVPLKLLPRYKKFLLDFNNGNYQDALRNGQDILELRIKVKSTNALRMLSDVKAKIKLLDNENFQ